jgi:hypothetical protein
MSYSVSFSITDGTLSTSYSFSLTVQTPAPPANQMATFATEIPDY